MEGSLAKYRIKFVAWTWLDVYHKSIAKLSSSAMPLQTLGMLDGWGMMLRLGLKVLVGKCDFMQAAQQAGYHLKPIPMIM